MQAAITRQRWTAKKWRSLGKGLLFVSPWILGYLAFTVYPILSSAYYSLTRYDVLREPRFVGLENYIHIFTEDDMFRKALGNTVYMVVLGVPAALAVAFLLASLLDNDMKARPFFRLIFFLPSLVPTVVSAEVWRWVYNTNWGVINSVLKGLGQPVIPFLSSEVLAKPSLILINCWAAGGAMIIFLAALQDVPRTLYDAAKVDGANALQRLQHVTIPMCTPAILFVLLTGMIGAFQQFGLVWLMTQGGPNQATEFYAVNLYRNAFVYFKMGYASGLAWILFVIIIIFTTLIMRSSARWVYYGGEAK